MNDLAKKDMHGYWRIFMVVAGVFFSLKLFLILLAYLTNSRWFLPLIGGLSGSGSATVNLLGISFAYYVVVMKGGRKLALLLPVATFLIMCLLAYIYAMFMPELVIEFALGLSIPILFASAIVSFDKPVFKA